LKKNYTVRPYHSGDEEEIVELLELVFDGWPKFDLECTPLDHWKWKYLDNPLKTSFIALGVNEDEIIGANQALPLRIKVGEEVFLGTCGSDLAVHPDYRRIGVKTRTHELKEEMRKPAGVSVTYSVTSNPILIQSRRRRGRPMFPHPLINLVRIRDIGRQIKAMPIKHAWLTKMGFNVVRIINDIQNVFRASKFDEEFRVREIHAFDERIEPFWEKVSKHYRFIIERNMDYLNWRYCDPRAGGFIVKQAENDEGEILGYVVIRINRYRKDYPIGFIADLITLPGKLDVANLLVADAMKYYDALDVNIVNFLVPKNHPHEYVMKRNGFLNSRLKIDLIFHPIENERLPIEKENFLERLKSFPLDKVYFTYGDIDSFPVDMPDYR
jgi:GNAT superfamily N-acetyltransferase